MADEKMTREAKLWAAGMVVAAVAIFVAIEVFSNWSIDFGSADEVKAVMQLDDATLLAIETKASRNKGAQGTTYHSHDRLHVIDARTGATRARFTTDAATDCWPARGRAWCRWGNQLYLLDAALKIVADGAALRTGPLAAGYQASTAAVERDGRLDVVANDGHVVRIDPSTRAVETTSLRSIPTQARTECAATLDAHANIGHDDYSLPRDYSSQVPTRTPLWRRRYNESQPVAPNVTWLGGKFLGNGACTGERAGDGGLSLADSLFIVDLVSLEKGAKERLSRVRFDGVSLWTVTLPAKVESGVVVGDTVVLSGTWLTMALGLADGRERWRIEH